MKCIEYVLKNALPLNADSKIRKLGKFHRMPCGKTFEKKQKKKNNTLFRKKRKEIYLFYENILKNISKIYTSEI